ncbi:MAG: sigma-70 family RNA polymerase sigma factor [Aliifodinibius sp.]|nr:sigma-70 family RNA polymerase sigma factor [candidate division Zixibacteria bacterium]NIT59404.1 sigma-70 family RNA polymerase sigma factor [Fodinibius sp.]NIW46924.1 sigma-70 family RNA polymerase sigma factor [Gammaproteobacteria bacterium]NIR65795.1 sigma-70 family RNA polymerase sigma factor [candidate division Zixibacteria bacterium]NIS47454.1 sigma-70 family RNA polymerase sigma factor [candidate division Zixibacteria bacterium]
MRQFKHQDSTESDAELITHTLQGNTGAFGVLYDRYLHPLFRYIYYRVANYLEAEDLTELVFLKAWEALRTLDPKEVNFRAWLYRIAHNTVIDHHRSRKTEVSLENISDLHHKGLNPEQGVQEKFETAQLAEAVSQLSPDFQQVITCRFILGISHAETAAIMNLKEGHVRVLQHRALKELKSLLTEKISYERRIVR